MKEKAPSEWRKTDEREGGKPVYMLGERFRVAYRDNEGWTENGPNGWEVYDLQDPQDIEDHINMSFQTLRAARAYAERLNA